MMLPVLNLATEEICEQHLMLELQPPKLLSSLGIHIIVDFFTKDLLCFFCSLSAIGQLLFLYSTTQIFMKSLRIDLYSSWSAAASPGGLLEMETTGSQYSFTES